MDLLFQAETGNDTTALILKGTAAGSVVVDGKSLKKLTNRPQETEKLDITVMIIGRLL